MVDNQEKAGGTFGLAVAQVGGIQPSESKAEVVERLTGLLRDAAARGADFVVFPELTLTTFFPRYWVDDNSGMDANYETSMPNDDVAPLFAAGRDLGVGFYLGYAELTPAGRRYNSSVTVDKEGAITGKYRKVHLPGHDDNRATLRSQHLEKKYFEVGDLGFGVFPTDGLNIGMALCNDRRWPEVYRALSLQGADLVVLGYNTPMEVPGWQEEPHAKMATHLLSLQAGAYQNSVWVAAAAKCGYEDGVYMIGGSAIVAPSGEIVAKAMTDGDEVVVAQVDLDMARPFRESVFDFAAHRRPEHYAILVERTGRGEPIPLPAGALD
ncbi:N-carbamoyl-D-amino-acid hydrolase [Pseudonocardia sulfidoxydans NBRC 16205]|uniref:N-carbamoyl-D-amino-acid hydrolase n=1 Tax=Pseudonocardia sulfidoxydans NBRC 16205 TaxID=1223511 RepID=A0A511DG37_9PSEU|nr:N-carbamoyl-D-amino-acid hydrolase [Pseudonocardia sulfidoxydans]GEL23756.1 N-carbamoyl-D-amino-acid hydrolase [Pseudonocardia sulfidoxydans NBRC 16205]